MAWGAAATMLAILVPALPASAASGQVSYASGDYVVGGSATFDVVCNDMPSGSGATVVLNRNFAPEVARYPVTMSSDTGTNRSGSVTISFAGLEPDGYSLALECNLSGGYQPYGGPSFTLTAADVATTTTLTPSSTTVVRGDPLTLSAGVPGADGGTVEFREGSNTLATVPLVSGAATTTVYPTGSTSFSAVYSGATGYLTSSSAEVTVWVITEITPPAGFGMGGTPMVGRTSTATTTGTWSPSTAQGLQLAYEWRVDDVVVSTDTSYVPTAAQAGKYLKLTVTATRSGLTSRQLWINLPIAPGNGVRGSLTVSGGVDRTATLGTPLVAQATGWSPTASLAYAWSVDGVPVATGPTYTPTVADLGKVVWVTLTATEQGQTTLFDAVYFWNVLTDPTITVGSSTVYVGAKATIPVTVSGPQGGPIPSGQVAVTVTPVGGGTAIDAGTRTLSAAGKASVTVPDLPVGRYTVTATYLPPQNPTFARYSVSTIAIGSDSPYRGGTGTGTVTVVKPAPVVDFPSALTAPVATPASAPLTVTGPRPSEYVVRLGDAELVRGPITAIGATRVTLPVLAPGTYQLTLVLPETSTSAAATRDVTLTVAGEPARTGSVPTAELATPKAATTPGQTMDLVADGFQPGETVAFYVHSDPVYLGTAVADADGIARLTATIPADLPVGAHTVIATGGTSGRWAQLAIELAVPGATPTATTPTVASDQILATTGAGSGSALAGAWLLLAVGAGLVLVVRRLRTVRGAA